MSNTLTRGIRVKVQSEYLPGQSNPQAQHYLFSYHIEILNEGMETVQLMHRHWIITDADGQIEEVKGPGVIGQQPVLEPGDIHSYSSFCPLKTPLGSMHGSFQMRRDDGSTFEAIVGEFSLRANHTLH